MRTDASQLKTIQPLELFSQKLLKVIDQLQAENTEFKACNAALQKQMYDLEQKLEIASELNREIKQSNSKNSSQPPSHDYKRSTKAPYNKGGAKPGHEAHLRQLLGMDRVDATERHTLSSCPNCGSNQLVIRDEPRIFQYIELVSCRKSSLV